MSSNNNFRRITRSSATTSVTNVQATVSFQTSGMGQDDVSMRTVISISSDSDSASSFMLSDEDSEHSSTSIAEEIESEGESTASNLDEMITTAAGVPLPRPISLSEIDTIELWSRKVQRRMITISQLMERAHDYDSAVK
ncbi:hypothetical protein BDF20DRAFT_840632 [Mycotypha africana]|uniref:uncharacterized protein n=1 Tax=Mycotypha africana TaxID=64632 RepID=UPI0023016BF5|nr:uncharacterized protein BDF20DRAFT_840632 [Mycotypha africana]KAI8966913.1 hypothetical protein BDF20DRAFT_840632 [Mycotypha africana]